MAHALELFSTGEAAFAVAREPAWHRLGTVTPGAMTAGEAIRAAHLADWRVEKRPVFTTDRNGMPVPIKGKFATVRQAPDPTGPRSTPWEWWVTTITSSRTRKRSTS